MLSFDLVVLENKKTRLINDLNAGEESGVNEEFDGVLILRELKEKYSSYENKDK